PPARPRHGSALRAARGQAPGGTRKSINTSLYNACEACVHGFRVRGLSLSSGRPQAGPVDPRPGMTMLQSKPSHYPRSLSLLGWPAIMSYFRLGGPILIVMAATCG